MGSSSCRNENDSSKINLVRHYYRQPEQLPILAQIFTAPSPNLNTKISILTHVHSRYKKTGKEFSSERFYGNGLGNIGAVL